MPEYLPFAGGNSVQEAVVALHFAGNLPPATVQSALEATHDKLVEELPDRQLIQRIQLDLPELRPSSTGGVAYGQVINPPMELSGFEYSRKNPSGKPARMVRMRENVLTVNHMEYVGWITLQDRALHYFRMLLPFVRLAENPVTSFSMRYINRFTFVGEEPSANADLLFKKNSGYISRNCFDRGPLWHCHTGWFDHIEGSRILNQYKIDSSKVDGVLSTKIDHNMVCQLNVMRQSIESIFEPQPKNAPCLEMALNYLHTQTKTILKNLLTGSMGKKIGL